MSCDAQRGDGGGHEIAYLRHRLAFGHTDMHEHAGFLAPGDTMGRGVLLARCAGDHHFDVTASKVLRFSSVMRSCNATSRSNRSWTTSCGTCSISAAGVPGRGE